MIDELEEFKNSIEDYTHKTPNGKLVVGVIVAALGIVMLAGLAYIVRNRDWQRSDALPLLVVAGIMLFAWKIRRPHRQPRIPELIQAPLPSGAHYAHGPVEEFAGAPKNQDLRPLSQQPSHNIDERVVSRYYWMMLALPAVVEVFAIVGFIIVTVQSDQQFKWTLAGLMVVAFGLMVGIPYVIMIYQLTRQLKQISRLTMIKRVSAVSGIVFFIGLIIWLFDRDGEALRWFGEQLVALARSTVDAVIWATSSPESIMTTILALATLKLLFQYIDWRINPLELDGDTITARTGIFRRAPLSSKISKITDLRSIGWERFPWVRVKIETSGQDQALDDIHWVPRKFFEALEARWNEQTSE